MASLLDLAKNLSTNISSLDDQFARWLNTNRQNVGRTIQNTLNRPVNVGRPIAQAVNFINRSPLAQAPVNVFAKAPAQRSLTLARDAHQSFQRPGLINKTMGALQYAGAAANLTPLGLAYNQAESLGASALQSARTKTNFLANLQRNIANPYTGIASTGLGATGAWGMVGDIAALNPRGTVKAVKGLSKLKPLLTGFEQFGPRPKTISHPEDIRILETVRDVFYNPKKYTQEAFNEAARTLDDMLQGYASKSEIDQALKAANRKPALQYKRLSDLLLKKVDYSPFGFRNFDFAPGIVENNKFKTPYKRGDIGKLQNLIDDELGTDTYTFSNKWQAKLGARTTAKDALEYAAKDDPVAAEALRKVVSLENQLSKAQDAKLVKPPKPTTYYHASPRSGIKQLQASTTLPKTQTQSVVGDLRKPQLGSYTNIRQADNPLVNQPTQNVKQSEPSIKIRQSEVTPQPAGVLATLKKQFQTTAKSLSQEANLKQQKYSTAKSLEQIIDNQPIDVKNKVGLIDYVRTPDRVLKKIGLEKESNLIRAQYDKYLTELPKEIDKITAWSKQVPKESNQRIFNYLDGQKVTLTAQEAKVAGEIREYLEQWADKLNLSKDKRIASYITHIFEKDFIQKEFDPELAKLIQDRVAGSVYDPFLEQRLGKLGYVEDTWRALDAYVKRATRKYHMDPALEQTKRAAEKLETSQFDYVKNYVDRINLRPTKLDNLVDNTIKQLVGYRFGQRPTAYLTRKGRQAVYRGTLGLNVGSALKNLSQGANTYAKLGEKYTIKGYLDLLRNGTDELNSQGVLKQEFIQDRNINATKKFWEKVDKGLFVFFDTAELINRGSAYYGAKAKALAKGASETDAIEYAKKIVRDTQFTFGSVDTPIAMQSDMAKLISQFQSFTLKQSEFLGEMAKNKEYAGLLRYALASMAFVYAAGDMIGMEPKDIIPSFRFGLPPTLNLPIELGKAALGAPDKYGNIPDTQERINNVGKSLIPFIPAGTQAKKTITGLEGVNKGYSETASGRVRFPIQQSTSNYIKGGVFGPWSLPEAREYFDKNRSVLSENQSALLKQATDKFGVYGEIIQKRELNKLIDKAREDIKSGKQSSVDAGSIKVVKVGDKIREIDMNRLANPPAYPQTTGNELLDKELVKDFKSSITAIKNDVTDLYKAGELSKEEAEKQLEALTSLYYSGSGGKKPKKITVRTTQVKPIKVKTSSSQLKIKKLPPPPKLKGFKFTTTPSKTVAKIKTKPITVKVSKL